jgi:beta-glucanase (GH16 family)
MNGFFIKKIIFTVGLITILIFVSCKTEEPIVPVQSVSFDKTEITLAEGDSVTLIPILLPAKAKTKTTVWTSSNEKVATVVNGKVKAISRGLATIKIDIDTVISTTCAITVTRTDIPYKLVWSEEFEGSTLDLTRWNYETGGGGFGNQEKQYYTNRPENIRLESGSLVIEAKKEVYSSNNYTSARINTRDKVAFTYGKIEARISLPVGKGTWAAYWMMGSNITSARWPLCGEIDIMEHIGSQPTMISHATHTSEKNGTKGNNWYNRQTRADVESNFHTYAIEWEKKYNEGDDNISFYIDGVKSVTVWEPHVNATIQQWPFKADFFIILNLAIGGTMGGSIDDAIFNQPVIMKVDYVRVYQRKL